MDHRALQRQSARQARLVADLLALLGAPREADLEALDLHTVVARVLGDRRSRIAATGARVDVVAEGQACRVLVDADRLAVAIGALLDDALEAGVEGGAGSGVVVVVRRSGAHATLVIRGEGEAQDLETTEARLGYAVAARIVASHGGTLARAFDATIDAYEVRVTLPLPGAVAAVSTHPVVPVESTHADLAGVRVLVVEDDEDSRELLTGVLEDAGAEVEAASHADAALAALERFRPDVLVSDIGLPGEDGYALIRRVRALGVDRGGSVPAIALTGFADLEDSRRAITAGFQVHVAKPIDPALLTHAVANVVGMEIAP